MDSDHRKRSKEQEQQRRRNIQAQLQSQSSNSRPREPLFGKPIEKKAGDNRIQAILGSYEAFPDTWADQRRCLGVADSTPSTPLPLHGKQSNPFTLNTASSLTTSTAGASLLRHQVAPPPSGHALPSIKREKPKTSSKLPKIDSRTISGNTGKTKATDSDEKPVSAQPSNILRVKSSKPSTKPHKVPQKKTSAHKSSSHSKPKVKKSHSHSQLLTDTNPPTTELPSLPTTLLPKSKKHLQNSLITPSTQPTAESTVTPPIKRVSSTGTVAVLTEKEGLIKMESSATKIPKKRKKKKKGKEKVEDVLVLKSDVAISHDSHVTVEPVPTSLDVQLSKHKRPLELHFTTNSSPVSEDTTMDAESVSSMLKELMNPLPSTLVTPIPTPIKSRAFDFPKSPKHSPKLSTIAETISLLPDKDVKGHLSSTSTDEEFQVIQNREALATAMSTLDKNLAAEREHTSLPGALPTRQRPGSCSSSSSSSDESSSDSDSETEDLLAQQIQMSLPTTTTTITPIKTTPPRRLSQLVSPLALDESANLSPAKSKVSVNPAHFTTTSLVTTQHNTVFNPQTSIGFNPQVSTGFDPKTNSGFVNPRMNPLSSEQELTGLPRGELIVAENSMDLEVSDSDSSSGSSSDSGSESESESSDSEEESVAQDKGTIIQSDSNRTNLNHLPQSSEDGLLTFNNSEAFLDSTDFLTGLDNIGALSSNTLVTSHTNHPPFGSETTMFTSNPASVDSTSAVSTPIPTPGIGTPSTGHKRKNPSSQKTARKAPKLPMKEAVPRTISITSSEYHSEEGEVTSETEDPPVFSMPPASTLANQITPTKQSFVGTLDVESLIIRYKVADLKRVPDQHKPKATVEPYNIRQTTESRTRTKPPESDPVLDRSEPHRERSVGRSSSREVYGNNGGRHRDDYNRSYHRNPRSRSHRDQHWEREPSRGRYPQDDRHPSGGRSWDRDTDYSYYWQDEPDHGGERSRSRGGRHGEENQSYGRNPEKYMADARRKKHEADKMPHGVDKAKAYMESVVLFMKYGDATEQQSEASSSSAKKNSAFRTYNETVAMIKYCQNLATDFKPLVLLCMRCQSVLLWRMYMIKLPTAVAIQKELQEYFIPPKGTQGKSPYHSSPLPSPASVGSTTSTGSGSWPSTQDPSPSASATIPKHIVNKATEHLSIASYVSQSVDLWKTSETLMYQCRDFFSNNMRDRTPWQRMSHCSPVIQVANWSDKVLRVLRYSNY